MKITFIKPNAKECAEWTSGMMQPLAFALLAGATPDGVEVECVDERLQPLDCDRKTDLVGISVDTFSARRAYQMCAEFKKRNIPVVLGGYHPTLVPEEAARFADAVVVGEGEDVWGDVVNDAHAHALKKIYRADSRHAMTGVTPRRDIFKGKRYLPLDLVQFSRGCYNTCEFCATARIYNHAVTHRPVDEVIAEVKRLGGKMLFWVDDNLIADKRAAKELFRRLVPLNVKWTGELSINVVDDQELFDLIVKSGCRSLFIGFETLNTDNLAQMGKSWNVKTGSYEAALQKIHDAGIKVYASFVFGYDADDEGVFERTVRFAVKHKFYLTNFSVLMPYPGTYLYERLKKEGRLLYERWWLDDAFDYRRAAFTPKRLSPEALVAGCWQARREFNRLPSIMRRGLDFKTNARDPLNAFIFLASNLTCRREILRRQPALS